MSVCTHLIMASRDCARRPKHRSNPPIAGSESGVTAQCPSRNVCACINTFSFGHDRGRSRHSVLKRSIRRYAFVWPFEETRSPRNSPRNFACVPCGTQAFLFITGRAARAVNVSRRRSSRGSARRSVSPGFEHYEAVRTLSQPRRASRRAPPGGKHTVTGWRNRRINCHVRHAALQCTLSASNRAPSDARYLAENGASPP